MAALFASGRVVDLILLLVALEATVLIGLRLWTNTGPPLLPLALTLASGAALMLALKVALTGGPWTAVALPLLIALAAHAGFVAAMWERTSRDRKNDRGR